MHWLLLLMVAGAAPPVTAQSARLESWKAIGDCKICLGDADLEATIGDKEWLLDGKPAAVLRDRLGRLFVLPATERGVRGDSLIAVFSPEGTFLRYLARRGQGPGELEVTRNAPLWLDIGDDDTLRVFAGLKVTLFSLSLAAIRSERLVQPLQRPAQIVDIKGALIENPFIDVDLIGPRGQITRSLLSLRSRDGRVLRVVELPAEGGRFQTRFVAPDTGAIPIGFWVTALHWTSGGVLDRGYHLMHLASDGRVLSRFIREPSFWVMSDNAHPPTTTCFGIGCRGAGPTSTPRPGSATAGIRVDCAGRLHVLLAQPDSMWRSVPRDEVFTRSHYSSVYEVVDPTRSAVVSGAIGQGYPVGLADASRFVTYWEDQAGTPIVGIWRASQTEPRICG